MRGLQATFDKAAISMSFLCTLHCLVAPIALTLLPALAASSFEDERFHLWLLIAVLPTSLIALTIGCRKHRNWRLVTIAVLGLTALTLTTLFGHEFLGETGEKLAIISSALIIAFGHARNYSLCKAVARATDPCAC